MNSIDNQTSQPRAACRCLKHGAFICLLVGASYACAYVCYEAINWIHCRDLIPNESLTWTNAQGRICHIDPGLQDQDVLTAVATVTNQSGFYLGPTPKQCWIRYVCGFEGYTNVYYSIPTNQTVYSVGKYCPSGSPGGGGGGDQ